MFTRRHISASLALSVLLSGFATLPSMAQTAVKLTLDWRFEGPAAGFLLAQDKGYFAEEGLDVTIDTGNGSVEAIPRVATGAYQFGFGDINSLIKFLDEDSSQPVKAIMMVYDKPTFSIVGRKSLGVTDDPKSVEGKKLGAPPPDGAFAQWPAFIDAAGIDASTVTINFGSAFGGHILAPYATVNVPAVGHIVGQVIAQNFNSNFETHLNLFPSDACVPGTSTPPTPGTSDVTIAKSASTATPAGGSTFTYSLTATNVGNATATGVVVRDALLVAGSSLTVMSGLRFVRHAAKAQVPVVIVNRGATRGDDLATLTLDAGTSETLTALADRL